MIPARAMLAAPAQQQGAGAGGTGRQFHAGTRGHAEPLHAGDEGGLWVFTSFDEARVLVPRSALKLDGEKEPPRPMAPSPARRGWRPWDAFAEAERPSLAASALRGLLL